MARNLGVSGIHARKRSANRPGTTGTEKRIVREWPRTCSIPNTMPSRAIAEQPVANREERVPRKCTGEISFYLFNIIFSTIVLNILYLYFFCGFSNSIFIHIYFYFILLFISRYRIKTWKQRMATASLIGEKTEANNRPTIISSGYGNSVAVI